MAVTGSSVTLEPAQSDGAQWCREVHTLTGGSQVVFYYLRAAGADATAIMTARVASVAAQAMESEALDNMARDGALTLNQQTAAQFAARFRQEVAQASDKRACYLAWWLLRRIAAGHITDAQCQTAFGLSAAQWTTMKTSQLQPRSDAWTAVLAAGGL